MSAGAKEGRPPSLLAAIARWLVLVTLLAVATTALLLYVEFKGTHDRMRQRTLSGVARVIEKARVGLSPGYLFGNASRSFLRMCVLRDPTQIREAADRMVAALS